MKEGQKSHKLSSSPSCCKDLFEMLAGIYERSKWQLKCCRVIRV